MVYKTWNPLLHLKCFSSQIAHSMEKVRRMQRYQLLQQFISNDEKIEINSWLLFNENI